jgi:hypothetical protein
MSNKVYLNLKEMSSGNLEVVVEIDLCACEEDPVANTFIELSACSSITIRVCMPNIYGGTSWHTDVQDAENEEQGTAENLDLSYYNLLRIPKQILCLCGTKQTPRGDPINHDVNRISIHSMSADLVATPLSAIFGVTGVERDRDDHMIEVLKL